MVLRTPQTEIVYKDLRELRDLRKKKKKKEVQDTTEKSECKHITREKKILNKDT